MKKHLFAVMVLLSSAVAQAQLAVGAEKALSLNLLKIGPISLSQNSPNVIGLPIGAGFASRINADWSYDINMQFGILGDILTTQYAKKQWFDVQVGFQKHMYDLIQKRLTVNANFGLGYINIQSIIQTGFFFPVRDIATGPYAHMGCVFNLKLTERLVLYNKFQLRMTAMTFASTDDLSLFSGIPNSGLYYKSVEPDFQVMPFEFGISYNFSAIDEN